MFQKPNLLACQNDKFSCLKKHTNDPYTLITIAIIAIIVFLPHVTIIT